MDNSSTEGYRSRERKLVRIDCLTTPLSPSSIDFHVTPYLTEFPPFFLSLSSPTCLCGSPPPHGISSFTTTTAAQNRHSGKSADRSALLESHLPVPAMTQAAQRYSAVQSHQSADGAVVGAAGVRSCAVTVIVIRFLRDEAVLIDLHS